METLRLFPIFSQGFDLQTELPFFLGLFSTATLTEKPGHILADIPYDGGALDFRIDMTADKQHPFKYHVVNGQKVVIGGDIGQIAVTASSGSATITALTATGLHAPVTTFLHDLLGGNTGKALVDLAKPGPITVKPAGATDGMGGDILYVPSVHALFDLRGVPGHELVELKAGDKVELSDEKFANLNAIRHDLASDGHGGWLLALPNDTVNSIDLELANGHSLTKAQAISHLILDA